MFVPFYTDIDECSAGTHDCDQICTNNAGSYTCSCNDGHVLDSNGRTCNGGLAYVEKLVHLSMTSLQILMSALLLMEDVNTSV